MYRVQNISMNQPCGMIGTANAAPADPMIAASVAAANAAAEEMDRVCAMNLAMVRSECARKDNS